MGDPPMCCVVVYCTGLVTVQLHELPPPLSLSLSLSPSTSLAAARPQSAVKWLLWWLNRIWKQKKKAALPSFLHPFLCLTFSFLWPCGVDFNRELAWCRWLKEKSSYLNKEGKNRDHHAVLILSESWLQACWLLADSTVYIYRLRWRQ